MDGNLKFCIGGPGTHCGDVFSRSTVNEYGGNERWNAADALLIESSAGATFRGSATLFTAFGSPASTIALALASTPATPRRLIAASTGVLPALTTLTITVRPALS